MEIEVAGTSQGGSSYTDRIIAAFLDGYNTVTVIVGSGSHQEATMAYIDKKADALLDLLRKVNPKQNNIVIVKKQPTTFTATHEVKARKATLQEYMEDLNIGIDDADPSEEGYIVELGTHDDMQGPGWDAYYAWYSSEEFHKNFTATNIEAIA